QTARTSKCNTAATQTKSGISANCPKRLSSRSRKHRQRRRFFVVVSVTRPLRGRICPVAPRKLLPRVQSTRGNSLAQVVRDRAPTTEVEYVYACACSVCSQHRHHAFCVLCVYSGSGRDV